MDIIDAHTHVFPPELIARREDLLERDRWFGALYANPRARMATVEELLASMDHAGVARAVTFGFAFADQGLCEACNAWVLDAAARHPQRLIPFAVANPLAGDAAQQALRRALEAGAQGIGELMPDGQGFALSDEDGLPAVLGLAREYERPVMVHISELLGHTYPGKGSQGPAEAWRLAVRFPANTFIYSHWGGGLPFYTLMPEVRRALANVYYDSAASLYLYDDAIFALAADWAPDRILFGSDYPLIPQERFLRRVRAARLGEPVLRRFLGANASCLLAGRGRPAGGGRGPDHG